MATTAWAANPCGTTAANRDLTGIWNSFTAAGALASTGPLTQNGASVTGGYQGTAATGHPNLILTFQGGTFDGNCHAAGTRKVRQKICVFGRAIGVTRMASDSDLS